MVVQIPGPHSEGRRAFVQLLQVLRLVKPAIEDKKQPPPFYDTNLFWGAVGVFAALYLSGFGFGDSGATAISGYFFLAAIPFMVLAIWCLLANITKVLVRCLLIVILTAAGGFGLWRSDKWLELEWERSVIGSIMTPRAVIWKIPTELLGQRMPARDAVNRPIQHPLSTRATDKDKDISLLERAIMTVKQRNTFEDRALKPLIDPQVEIKRHNASPPDRSEESKQKFAQWRFAMIKEGNMLLYRQTFQHDFMEMRRMLIEHVPDSSMPLVDYENGDQIGGICSDLSNMAEAYVKTEYTSGKVSATDRDRYVHELRSGPPPPRSPL